MTTKSKSDHVSIYRQAEITNALNQAGLASLIPQVIVPDGKDNVEYYFQDQDGTMLGIVVFMPESLIPNLNERYVPVPTTPNHPSRNLDPPHSHRNREQALVQLIREVTGDRTAA